VDGWFWAGTAVLAALLVADVAFRIFVMTLVLPIFEQRPPFNVPPAEPDPEAEPVRFATTDGLTLAGSYYRPEGEPRGLIVFCPEFGGTHWSAPSYARGLIDAGFAVLAFDFRNQGESDSQPGYTPTHWLTRREVADVAAALKYVEERFDLAELPVGLFGISRGANAALAAAAKAPQVRAVAAEGAFSTDAMMLYYSWRWAEVYVPGWIVRLVPEWHLAGTLRMARRVSQLRHRVRYTVLERKLPRLAGRPVLLVTGGKDSYVAPVIAERLREAVGPSCEPVWVVPGAKHNQARPRAPEEYDRRLAEFFGRIADMVPEPTPRRAETPGKLLPMAR
jgi:pimeloyl-ACP methyl ester carboxylesterase